jgi:hypothetical protein
MDKDLNVYGTTGVYVEIPIFSGFGKKLPKLLHTSRKPAIQSVVRSAMEGLPSQLLVANWYAGGGG